MFWLIHYHRHRSLPMYFISQFLAYRIHLLAAAFRRSSIRLTRRRHSLRDWLFELFTKCKILWMQKKMHAFHWLEWMTTLRWSSIRQLWQVSVFFFQNHLPDELKMLLRYAVILAICHIFVFSNLNPYATLPTHDVLSTIFIRLNCMRRSAIILNTYEYVNPR